MATNNLPAGGNGEDVSTAEIVDELADILGEPATDNGGKNGKEPEDDGDIDEGKVEDEDPDGEAADEGQDQLRDAQGRFLSDKDKVILTDGTTTTVAELKNGYLRQGDYTRKTQATAEESKAVKSERERVGQLNQQLGQQLAVASQWLEMTKPVRPAVSYSEDPIAHGEFQDAMQRWNEARQWIGQNVETQAQAIHDQQSEAVKSYQAKEAEALRSAIPALRDPGKYRAFRTEVEKIAPDYGITAEELDGVHDHRQWLVLRDALAYRRLKAKAPEVRQAIESRPQMLKSGKRPNQAQATNRAKQARTERLRKEGTVDAGVAALMDMDL
jgi:hypothetical protein